MALLRDKGYIDLTYPIACPESAGGPSFEGFKAPYTRNVRSTTLLAWDAVPHLSRGQEMRNVLYADCSVQSVSEAEFQKLLVKHDAYAKQVMAALANQAPGK